MKNSIYTRQFPTPAPTGATQYLKNLFLPFLSRGPKIGESLQVDVHGHWLPAVDDGAQTEREALTMVKGLVELGFKKLIATPHIKAEYEGNNPKTLKPVFEHFKKVVKKAGIEVELSLAAEYMLDESFENHLESGPLLTLHGKMVLVELNPMQVQILPILQKTLFKIKSKGYQPVLAHPERYAYYFENWQTIEGLKESGCLFQGNALAIGGYESKEIVKRARKLQEQGWYEFVGTDIHRPQHIEQLDKVALSQEFRNSLFK